jgi:hypothetical protein
MPKNLKITRVLRVVDSRECEECGDRWVPVPGTGVQRKCDRCGRLHEVHAYVQLEDGSVATVGTGCMRGESLEVQGRMKSAASAAKTIARLKAELVHWKDVERENSRIWAEVDKLTPPGAVLTDEPDEYGLGRVQCVCGDVERRLFPGWGETDTLFYRPLMHDLWREKRRHEAGYDERALEVLDKTERRLLGAERRLAKLLGCSINDVRNPNTRRSGDPAKAGDAHGRV